jgi:hypothetical protein
MLDRAELNNYPQANSSADSSGVPQMRQRTAEQSPHTRGSWTGRAQVGHQRSGVAEALKAAGGTEDVALFIQFERSTGFAIQAGAASRPFVVAGAPEIRGIERNAKG